MEIQAAFGARVKELRLSKKVSQEQLANEANIDRTYMTSVENGRRNISIQNIDKILSALGVDYTQFFDSSLFNKKSKRRVAS